MSDNIVLILGFLVIIVAGFLCGYLMFSMLKILYELALMQVVIP
jgi:hypothetical protein